MFAAAYQLDADWAIANLTTWLVWIGLLAAVANFAVVITAFVLQRNDHRVANLKTVEVHLAALQTCSHALELFDIVIGGKNNVRAEISRSDVVGRINTFKRLIDYYLSQGIVELVIVHALITVATLYERTLADMAEIPEIGPDQIAGSELDRLYAFRQPLRDGAQKIVDAALQMRVEV